MREIRILFTDFWQSFNPEDNFILSELKKNYQITLDAKNPEYLFYSLFGIRHFQYKNSIKIYFTGENDVPDFNLCDYGIGSAPLNFGDRYLRFPLYVLSDGYETISEKANNYLPLHHSQHTQRKFCNFVYSNAQKADPIREAFFHQLSNYKKVDSGGKYLNNIGQPITDKLNFIKDYKFTVAFENSFLPGYTTEKLIDPMCVDSLPIYWGNPDVGKDFNPASFVNFSDYHSMDEVIKEVIFLDNNDEAYIEKLSQPWIEKEKRINFKNELNCFLKRMIDLPFDEAKRTVSCGYNHFYRKKQLIAGTLYNNSILRPLLKRIIR